jgi:hypothetical protein
MTRWVLVSLLCLAVLASGCITMGVAFTDPKNTPRSHVIAGGILGDGAIAGVFNAAKGEYQMGESEPTKNFLGYYAVLLALDTIGAVIVWYRNRPEPAPAPAAAPTPP